MFKHGLLLFLVSALVTVGCTAGSPPASQPTPDVTAVTDEPAVEPAVTPEPAATSVKQTALARPNSGAHINPRANQGSDA